jgi:hypothetical protein
MAVLLCASVATYASPHALNISNNLWGRGVVGKSHVAFLMAYSKAMLRCSGDKESPGFRPF